MKSKYKGEAMIFEYKDERVEYPTYKLHRLKNGKTVYIDFNGHYMIEFKKTKSGTLVTTGNGIDGYCRPINVDKIEVKV